MQIPDFLQQQLQPKVGEARELEADANNFDNYRVNGNAHFETKRDELEFLTAPYQYQSNDGKKVGEHQGAHYYTIGQRKGLGIGGTVKPLLLSRKI